MAPKTASAAHIPGMAARKSAPAALVLLCIRCGGGSADKNGAYTLCALCELDAGLDAAA